MNTSDLHYRAAVIFALRRFVEELNELALKVVANDWVLDVYVPKFDADSLLPGTFEQLLEEFNAGFDDREQMALEWFHQCVLRFRQDRIHATRIGHEAARLLQILQ